MTGPDALLVCALALLSMRLFAALPAAFGVDSWLELVTGRLLWAAGIPHHETLTSIGYGRPWIDQQWLAQLSGYGLYRVGGLGLLGVVNVALLVSGLAVAVGTARRLGASVRDVLAPSVLCGWLFLPGSEVRTQAFAVPLFAVTVYLLAIDSRRPSARVYWTLPILVLWANLHGSATLGAGLVALRGVTLAWERRSVAGSVLGRLRRPVALVVGAPLALLLTPYGLHSIAYYRATLGNSALRHMASEWQPVTSSPMVAVAFLLLVGVTIWSCARFPERTRLWERLALLALAAASVGVIRNVLFFALAALALLPVSLLAAGHADEGRSATIRRGVNGVAAALALALAGVFGVVALARPAGSFQSADSQPAVLAAVARATRDDPRLRVWADPRYGDWLLWRVPSLAGRMDADARYEVYTASQLKDEQRLVGASGPGWKRAAQGDRLLVLDRSSDGAAVTGFMAEPGARILYTDRQAVVILRRRAGV
jgi:hypothetical protein